MAYATTTDLATYALPSIALSAISSGDQAAALAEASAFADGFLASRYATPLTSYGVDLTAAVSRIAAYRLLRRQGFDSPGEGSGFRRDYDDAERWLRDVSRGIVTVSGGSTTAAPTQAAQVETATVLGWHDTTSTSADDEDGW